MTFDRGRNSAVVHTVMKAKQQAEYVLRSIRAMTG